MTRLTTLLPNRKFFSMKPWNTSFNIYAYRYRALLSRFHVGIKHPDPSVRPDAPPHEIPIIGFSATFGRHDGLALGSVFERIVYHRDFLEMIKEQW